MKCFLSGYNLMCLAICLFVVTLGWAAETSNNTIQTTSTVELKKQEVNNQIKQVEDHFNKLNQAMQKDEQIIIFLRGKLQAFDDISSATEITTGTLNVNVK